MKLFEGHWISDEDYIEELETFIMSLDPENFSTSRYETWIALCEAINGREE